MNNSSAITQERLKEVLSYNETTGVFVWLVDKSLNSKKGKVAGCVNGVDGNMKIRLDSVNYSAARLAWLYCYGTLLASPVYRLDKDAGNSAVANLTLTAPPLRKAKPHNKLTQTQLLELLTYCAESGVWTWNEARSNRSPEGTRAGSICSRGNRRICVLGTLYPASRLAYLFMIGSFPNGLVYRVDEENSNDRWDNLTCSKAYASKFQQQPTEKTRKTLKAHQDTEAAAWKELCRGAEPPPPFVTEVPGGTVKRTAQWVWFESSKPEDCLMAHNEEMQPVDCQQSGPCSRLSKIRGINPSYIQSILSSDTVGARLCAF